MTSTSTAPASPWHWLVALGLVLLSLLLLGGRGTDGDRLFYERRPAMGTFVEAFVYAAGEAQAQALFAAAFEEVERVEAALSTYRPASELSRVNAHAAQGPVTTDPEVFGLLKRALVLGHETGGAFDVSVGALMRAWGFFKGEGRYPSDAALAAAPAGYARVALEPEARTVRFLADGLVLDLGGIGKGYALDRAAAVLRARGVERALLGMGGSSFYALGAPPEEAGWAVDVPDPFDPAETLETVRLRDGSLSTSGNFEKFFDLDGRRYCHIIDPRTKHPVPGRVQVTVTAPTAEASDALSTALFVLGPEAGAALLAERPGTAALFVEGETEAAARVARVGRFHAPPARWAERHAW